MRLLPVQLTNQSGQIANVAHVLGTFYDKSGKWYGWRDQYVDQRSAAADSGAVQDPYPGGPRAQGQQPANNRVDLQLGGAREGGCSTSLLAASPWR